MTTQRVDGGVLRDYIFISYSHKDEQWLDKLHVLLKPFPWGQSFKAGGLVWADPYIETGERWRQRIVAALARTRIAILLVSPDFLASEFITNEELPVLLEGAKAGDITIICVPVRSTVVDLSRNELLEYQWPRPYDQPLDSLNQADSEAALARIFRKLFDIVGKTGLAAPFAPTSSPAINGPSEIDRAVSQPPRSRVPGKLMGVPGQRPHFIPRVDVRERIRSALLSGSCSAVGLTAPTHDSHSRIGVFGLGGLGKTVSAIDVVQDPDLRRTFSDGIYWLTVGQAADIIGLQSVLTQQVTGSPSAVPSVAAGASQLRAILADHACLIVLDDVWTFEQAAAFDVLGPRGRLLVTTRDAGVLTALGAHAIGLDVLSDSQALTLLAKWTSRPEETLPTEARTLVRRCGSLPLALSVAGAMVRDGTTWGDILTALDAGNLRFLDHPYASVFASLSLSLDVLPGDMRARYLELAVALEDAPLPTSVITQLWSHTAQMKPHDSRQLLVEFERRGLLYLEDGHTRVRFHDLQRDFLQLTADDLPGRHERLLEAFAGPLPLPGDPPARPWWRLSDNESYLWRHISRHLMKALGQKELRALLLNYEWIAAKLRITDINALLGDYDALADDPVVEQVQGALRLSAHVLVSDRSQLLGQLHGRLTHLTEPDIQAMLATGRTTNSHLPWLRPLTATLTRPGGPLIRTFEGHTAEVHGVAVTPDGRRVVSASEDGTLKVWDLAGGELVTLAGHTAEVRGIAVTADGRRAVSASDDGTMKVWDLASGAELHSLKGHSAAVRGVAVTPDARYAISASDDETVRVWDLTSGRSLHTLEGHSAGVRGVAVTPDGRRAVSASDDETVKVWDLSSGENLNTIEAHRAGVRSVAITPDGQRVTSASADGTVKVWDLETASQLHCLEGQTGGVYAVAVTPGARYVVSGSENGAIKVWDLARGAELQTLEGHTGSVYGLAVTQDGRYVVSASEDGTVKLWDLASTSKPDTVARHTDSVSCVVVTTDGRRAVSASIDGTLMVWDVASGAALQRLKVHTDVINGLAVTPDGQRVVSAWSDGTLIVWDLAQSALLHTLIGHTSGVNGVAVTPDGRRAISASADGTVKVWDLARGEELKTLTGHTNWVNSVVITPDGRRAVSASSDRTLKVWDLARGAVLHTLEGHTNWVTGVVVSPDGERAVSTSKDGTVKAWNLARGAELQTLEGQKTGGVNGVAVSPDGRRTALATADGTVKLWDVARPAQLKTLEGHSGLVTGVAMTADGRRAVSVSDDRRVRAWDLTTLTALATFTADAGLRVCKLTDDPSGVVVIAGDKAGGMHILRLENAQIATRRNAK
jgi:WD40 repeat protein